MRCKKCGREVSKLTDGLCNTCSVIKKNEEKIARDKASKKKVAELTGKEIKEQEKNAELLRRTGEMFEKDKNRDKATVQAGGDAHLNKVVDGKIIKKSK